MLTLKSVVSAIPSLQYISGIQLPASISYKVGTFLRKTQVEVEEYQKQVQTLYLKHATDDKDGKKVLREEVIQDYTKEMEELLESEIDLRPPQITMDKLLGRKIKPSLLEGLIPMMLPDPEGSSESTEMTKKELIAEVQAIAQVGMQEFTVSETGLVERILHNLHEMRSMCTKFAAEEKKDGKEQDPEKKVILSLCKIGVQELEIHEYPPSVYANLAHIITDKDQEV